MKETKRDGEIQRVSEIERDFLRYKERYRDRRRDT